MSTENLKKQAAETAVTQVESGMVLGLGTGSTAAFAVKQIGYLYTLGQLKSIVCVPTSERTRELAERYQLPIVGLEEYPRLDLTIDGADEIAPELNLIKGLGGALLREKIVAYASDRFIVIADGSKQVSRLGEKAPVPVEIVPFSHRPAQIYLEGLGAEAHLRMAGLRPFVTDEGNYILDCHFERIDDPHGLGLAMMDYPGVVQHGLFLGLATEAFVATEDGVERIAK